MARFFSVFALLQLKNIISDKPGVKTYLIYGPGIISIYLGLSGASMGEFLSYNMLFYGGIGSQIIISETTSLELRLGYNLVPSNGWDKISGTLDPPNDFAGKGLNASISLFFGG